jgi:hypothetical protein
MRRVTAWSAIGSSGPGQGNPGAFIRSSTSPCRAAQTWAASQAGSSAAAAIPVSWQRRIEAAKAWNAGIPMIGRPGSPVGARWLNRNR